MLQSISEESSFESSINEYSARKEANENDNQLIMSENDSIENDASIERSENEEEEKTGNFSSMLKSSILEDQARIVKEIEDFGKSLVMDLEDDDFKIYKPVDDK